MRLQKQLASKGKGFSNLRDFLTIVLLGLICAGIYLPSINSPFIYDDYHSIVDNPHIKDFKNVGELFSSPEVVSASAKFKGYRPLLMFSFLVNWHLNHLNPRGYRLFNVATHFLNAAMIFLLLRLISNMPALKQDLLSKVNYQTGLFSSLLFLVHPINTEAVNYIVSRSSLMASFFLLLAFYLWIKSFLALKERGLPCLISVSYYRSSLICYVMALLSKEIAIVFPIILLLFELYFISKELQWPERLRRILRFHFPYFFISALYLFWRLYVLAGFKELNLGRNLYTHFLTQSKVFMHYLRLLFIPVNLCLDRYVPISQSALEWQVLFSLALILSILFLAWQISYKVRLSSFFIIWIFLTILPTSLINLNIVMKETRLYLPSIGFCIAISTLTCRFCLEPKIIAAKLNKAVIIFFSIAILIFSLVTARRNFIWSDPYLLWNADVKASPDSFGAHYHLGNLYYDRGQYDQALDELKQTIALNPKYAYAYNALGLIYYEQGFFDLAIQQYKKALTLDHNLGEAHNNLGVIYKEQGMRDQAIKEYKQAINLSPYFIGAYNNLGIIYMENRLWKDAFVEYQKAISINPDDPTAYNCLGILYAKLLDYQTAGRWFRKAIQLGRGGSIVEQAEANLNRLPK